MSDFDLGGEIDAILRAARQEAPVVLGESRDGRPVTGLRLGHGPVRISLIAGCHADEPVGPRLLRHLVGHLHSCPADHPLLTRHEWWVVPHANPDGEDRNLAWHGPDDRAFDPVAHLAHRIRELPGDDVEFGFPRSESDPEARPENQALAAWWRSAGGPFHLHASLHGMATGAGPWFLIDRDWVDRTDGLQARCRARVAALGYGLHDVERHGEKGFTRIGRGFCTRPNSESMRRYFLDRQDHEMARRFRPSSMETMRALGGDPLTLVSEAPLFITPGVGETLGPPDPVADRWRERIAGWSLRLERGEALAAIRSEMAKSGLVPMPVEDQMRVQWELVAAGVEAVTGDSSRTGR